jgi:hypothetical protein
MSFSPYGIDEALTREAARLATVPNPTEPNPELDRLIRSLGPFQVGHFLRYSEETKSVAALRAYLHEHWRAWANFIEQMIAAARRDRDYELYRLIDELGSD